MSKLPLAIVLGIDTPIGLTVVRELGEQGIPVHGIARSPHSIGGASRWLSAMSVRPQAVALADWLPQRIRETGASALFAISEDDLVDLADCPEEIDGCRILSPRAGPLSLALDKRQTLQLAVGVGIDVPQTWQPVSGEDFAAKADSLPFPLVAKWADPPAILGRLATAGIDFVKAEHLHNRADVHAMLDRYQPLGDWPLVQQFCPGEGVGHMLHMANDKATLRFQHRRIHEWPPEGGVSTLCESMTDDADEAQFERSEALLAAMGWTGPAMVEYRFDRTTGRYWLMEVNGRFWGSLPLAWHAGAHFALEQYRHAFPGRLSDHHQPVRKRRARYMIPETRRLLTILRTGQAEGRTRALWSYLSGFFDPRMRYFVFSWRDPGPMVRDLSNILLKVVRRGKQS